MTADRFPRAGEHDGLYFAMGYSGHGVQMSVHMGQVLAEMMQGRRPRIRSPRSGRRSPAISDDLVPALVGAYYKALDRIR